MRGLLTDTLTVELEKSKRLSKINISNSPTSSVVLKERLLRLSGANTSAELSSESHDRIPSDRVKTNTIVVIFLNCIVYY